MPLRVEESTQKPIKNGATISDHVTAVRILISPRIDTNDTTRWWGCRLPSKVYDKFAAIALARRSSVAGSDSQGTAAATSTVVGMIESKGPAPGSFSISEFIGFPKRCRQHGFVQRSALTEMVSVYVDESEDNQTGVFTLAGWLASPTGWKDIVPAWNAMVASAPHPIQEFHMADIARRVGEFADEKGWTKDERHELVKTATDILTDKNLSGGLTGFGVSIIRREVGLNWPTATTYDLYKAAYQVLMTLVCGTFAAFKSFDFVFDSKEKVRGHVNDFFWKAKDDTDRIPDFQGMLRDVRFEPSVKFAELQAADFIAYERRKRHSDRVSGAVRHRTSWQRLCERPHHFKVIDNRFVTAVEAEAARTGRTENLRAYRFIPDDTD